MMSMVSGIIARARSLWRSIQQRSEVEAEMSDEFRVHMELRAADLARSGLSPAEAARRARLEFGSTERYKAEGRDSRGLRRIDDLRVSWLDFKLGCRRLARDRGLTVVGGLTIALGIGIVTAVISIADHVLVRGLPFRDSGRLMMLLERDDHGQLRTPSSPTAADWLRDPGVARAFEGLTFVRGDGVSVRVGSEDAETVGSGFVVPEFFTLLGTRPAYGRVPATEEYRPGAPRVAVVSHRLWKRRLGGDPGIVGRTIDVDSIPTTVVGVFPRGAEYPGMVDLWIPIAQYRYPEILQRRGLHADSRTIARLRPGVDSASAAALMRNVGARLGVEYPREQGGWVPAMMPLRNEVIGNVRPMLLTLAGAAAAVLLLVCANVASLLLARLTTRTRELAVRSALGASRGRIVAQLLTESLILAVVGGALGTGFAALCLNLARTVGADRIPRAAELSVDYRLLTIATAATVVTALACGVWPAVRATRWAGGEVLRASSLGSVGIRSETRLRRLLVTVQFALALMLLVGAGLLLQSFRRAAMVDVGFDPAGVVMLRIRPPVGAYSEPRSAAALYARLIDAARAVPGVIDAAFINHTPFGPASITTSLSIDSRPALDSSNQLFYRTVSAEYLRTMRMSMAAGRWFDDADVRSWSGSFVINETMARQHWQGSSALGQRITVTRASQARADFGEPLTGTIIGIVADVHQSAQDVVPVPEVYVPYTVETWPWGMLVVRARDGTRSIPVLSEAVRSVDSRLLPAGAAGEGEWGNMESAVAGSLGARKLSMSLIAAFAMCALVLAAMGMYGVVAHNVAQRTREIGVRKALGATDAAIVGLVLRESLLIVAAGVTLGCAAAWGGARLIRALLFDTGVADPAAYVGTIGLLIGVALVATYLPARQAMRLEPTVAMRAD